MSTNAVTDHRIRTLETQVSDLKRVIEFLTNDLGAAKLKINAINDRARRAEEAAMRGIRT